MSYIEYPNIFPPSPSLPNTAINRLCEKCNTPFASPDPEQKKCYSCMIQDQYACQPVDIRELEDRIDTLEEALKESEAELHHAEARIDVLLKLLEQMISDK